MQGVGYLAPYHTAGEEVVDLDWPWWAIANVRPGILCGGVRWVVGRRKPFGYVRGTQRKVRWVAV